MGWSLLLTVHHYDISKSAFECAINRASSSFMAFVIDYYCHHDLTAVLHCGDRQGETAPVQTTNATVSQPR